VRKTHSIEVNCCLRLTSFVEVREKSSHYGLDMLGYTCATKVNTMGRNSESWSKARNTT